MLSPAQFRMQSSKYLTSARPIQNLDHLKGRIDAHRRCLEALCAPGRHVFIYGARGVGKTSLAKTAAKSAQSYVKEPIMIACDHGSTFNTIFSDLMKAVLSIDPLKSKGIKIGGGVTVLGTGGSLTLEKQKEDNSFLVNSVNEAIAFVKSAQSRVGGEQIIIVDEFEFFIKKQEQQKFATFLKQLSEQNVNMKIIACGIADSIEDVFSAHESVHRCVHVEKLNRLKLGAGIEILQEASDALEIIIPEHIKFRIAQSSDGFPYYIHLLAEKLFSLSFRDQIETTNDHIFQQAINEAVISIEPKLKRPYDESVKKNTRGSEHVLWAVANDDLLEVQVSTIWQHYEKICRDLRVEPISKANMSTKLHNLAKDSHGNVLNKPRRSYFAFSETMLRGYARLEALRSGISLRSSKTHCGRQNMIYCLEHPKMFYPEYRYVKRRCLLIRLSIR